MKSLTFGLFLILINLCSDIESNRYNSSCGLDRSPVMVVYEGVAAIETYPWLGMLYYPYGTKRITTSVVLVTRQLVIAAASEIDRLPKTDFRYRVRVVLGHKCGEGAEIKVRDYTYHPEFERSTVNALAMLQLETDHLKTELRPICQPPSHFLKPQFYAMTVSENCKNPKVRIHRMKYVNINQCKNFYRRSGLGQDSLWPTHAACARALSGGKCVWRSGSVLAVKQDGRWRMLGFSVYGPGCGDPARFMDYGMYHQWVQRSSATVGQPAITRIADNYLVVRRSLSNIQRYGMCDPEERITELYSDRVTLFHPENSTCRVKYNVSLYAGVEYSCITFNARPLPKAMGQHKPSTTNTLPKLRLKRWCATPAGMCSGFQHLEIQFHIDITFQQPTEFMLYAYGKEAQIIDPSAAMRLGNRNRGLHPSIPEYEKILKLAEKQLNDGRISWFRNETDAPKKKG